jgi:hypothetical protein
MVIMMMMMMVVIIIIVIMNYRKKLYWALHNTLEGSNMKLPNIKPAK